MVDNKNNWKWALEVFSQVSTWVIVPIILALLAGKALDRHFGTKPWIFLAFIAVSFGISCFGITREIKKYMKSIEEIGNEKNLKNNGNE